MHQPNATLTATENGYQLNFTVQFTGDETDEDRDRVCRSYHEAWEQVRLIVQTLTLVGFQAPVGRQIMEHSGSGAWLPSQPAPEPSPSPAVTQVKELLRVEKTNGQESKADPVLHAALQGRAPFLTKPLAAALTESTPMAERPTLARALGSTAEAIYLWLCERGGQAFTVGEIGRALSHSDFVTASRLKDLEGAALVVRGARAGQGKHKQWATYRAATAVPRREERQAARR